MLMIIKLNAVDYTNECQEGTFFRRVIGYFLVYQWLYQLAAIFEQRPSVRYTYTVGLAVQWDNRNH